MDGRNTCLLATSTSTDRVDGPMLEVFVSVLVLILLRLPVGMYIILCSLSEYINRLTPGLVCGSGKDHVTLSGQVGHLLATLAFGPRENLRQAKMFAPKWLVMPLMDDGRLAHVLMHIAPMCVKKVGLAPLLTTVPKNQIKKYLKSRSPQISQYFLSNISNISSPQIKIKHSAKESTAKEVSFEWSHHRISSTDSKVVITLNVFIIVSGSGRVKYKPNENDSRPEYPGNSLREHESRRLTITFNVIVYFVCLHCS